jgi:predicted phage tail protein
LGEGPIKGLVDGDKSFYVGDTPLRNADGEYNFKLFETKFFPGNDPADPVKPKLGGFANSTSVNVTLAYNTPVSRQTTTGEIDFIDVRLTIPALYRQDDRGVYNEDLQLRVEYKPASSGTWQKFYNGDFTISGKTTTTYVKELRQSVQRMSVPYDIRVTKLSTDSDTEHVRVVTWESFQEIDAEPKDYPNTAIIQVAGQATDQFTSVPQFSGIYDGRIIRVPTNYNPLTRAYTGLWDGTFKLAWSNNPAWILYDFVTNDRYGINSYYDVTPDKYDFYEAGQWCDTPVDDGFGGQQPRYTMNMVISEAMNGKEMAAYLAGSFNAALIDNSDGTVSLKVDKDESAVAIFTPENISSDGFSYSYTDLNVRYNDITVTFLNPDLDWVEDRRRVFDQPNIDKYGRVPLDFVAVGCTNAAEAIRRAKYKLVTALTEKEMVTFKTNRLGQFVEPWNIILIADPDMGYAVSGRIRSINGARTVITLRDPVYLEVGVDYVLKVQYPGQIVEQEVLVLGTGLTTTLTLYNALPTGIPAQAVFTLEDSAGGQNGLPKPYRVIKTNEIDGSPDLYEITAVEVNRLKFDTADQLEALDPPGYQKAPTARIAPPTDMTFTNVSYVASDGTYRPRLRVDWKAPAGVPVANYQVQFKLTTDGEYEGLLLTEGNATSIILTVLEDRNDYDVRVRTVNNLGFQSEWLTGTSTGDIPNDAPPGQCTGLQAVGGLQQISLNWTNPSDLDLKHIEIWAGSTNNLAGASRIGVSTGTFYVHTGLPNNATRFYWVRAVDRSGNVGEYNSNLGTSGTTRLVTGTDLIENFVDGSILLADLTTGVLSSPQYKAAMAAVKNLLAIADTRFAAFKLEQGESVRSFATVTQEISTVYNATQAVASSVTTLTTNFNNNVAAVQSSLTSLSNAISAEAAARLVLAARVTTTEASIVSEQTARATADSALASDISTLSTTVGNNTAAITTAQTSINGLSAQYTVKIDINGRVSGFGLASTAVNATPTSEFIIIADKFALVRPGSTASDPIIPFLIQNVGGQDIMTFQGEIKANAVTADKIVAGSVTTPKLNDAAVTTTKISLEAISTNKLGNDVGTFALSGTPSYYAVILDVPVPSGEIGNYVYHLEASAECEFDAGSTGVIGWRIVNTLNVVSDEFTLGSAIAGQTIDLSAEFPGYIFDIPDTVTQGTTLITQNYKPVSTGEVNYSLQFRMLSGTGGKVKNPTLRLTIFKR